jgi:hypothetical protein
LVVASAVHNDERLPVEIILKILSFASLPSILAFKATSRFWNAVHLDLPPITARLLRCAELSGFLVKHGWQGSSPGVHGIWEFDTPHRDLWIQRFEKAIDHADIAARLPLSLVRFMQELPAVTRSNPFQQYLRNKRPSLPPSPPRNGIPLLGEFPLNIEGMYLLNHPSWYTEDMYVRYALTPTRYTDLQRPWFSKRERKVFVRKYHLIRGTNPPKDCSPRRVVHVRRLSPTREYSSDTSDDGTPGWEKHAPEGPHAFGPNLIHFAQHTLILSDKQDDWPPAHILCVQVAVLQPIRNTPRRASHPAFLMDIEVESLKSDEMAFLEWCVPDDGVEYHLVVAVEGEMQGSVFIEAERQLITLVGSDWGEIWERWLTRCAGYIARNDFGALRRR